MAKKKLRKTLPKDLEELMDAAAESGDYGPVKAALESCAPDAYGGVRMGTALHSSACTPELAAWLVAGGHDVNAVNHYGETPLHGSAFARFRHRLPPADLIRLGADVHARSKAGLTPLHFSADAKNMPTLRVLLDHGADPRAACERGLTPLGYALMRLSNTGLADMAPVAAALLEAGDEETPAMQEFVLKAAKNFEFHRAAFDKDTVQAASDGLLALCSALDVTPPKARRMHDGTSPIVATAPTWQERHQELWELLVPSSGACETVQGEVIRASGRIADELHRNGGANWGAMHSEMARSLGAHLGSHSGLEEEELQEARRLIKGVRADPDEATLRLMELAVAWVGRNPTPHVLKD